MSCKVFSPNFQVDALWDKGERFMFWGQKVKLQGHGGVQTLDTCVLEAKDELVKF